MGKVILYDIDGNEVYVDEPEVDEWMKIEVSDGVLRHSKRKPPQKYSDEYLDHEAVQRHIRRVVRRMDLICKKAGYSDEQTQLAKTLIRERLEETGPKTKAEIKDVAMRRQLNAAAFDECYAIMQDIRSKIGDAQ